MACVTEYSAEQLNYYRTCYITTDVLAGGLRTVFKQESTTAIIQQRENGKMSPKMDLTFIVRNPRVTKEEIPGFWTPWLMGIMLSGTARCFFKPSSSPTVSRVWARPFTQMYMISKIFETNTLRTCNEINSQTWNFRVPEVKCKLLFKLSVSLRCKNRRP